MDQPNPLNLSLMDRTMLDLILFDRILFDRIPLDLWVHHIFPHLATIKSFRIVSRYCRWLVDHYWKPSIKFSQLHHIGVHSPFLHRLKINTKQGDFTLIPALTSLQEIYGKVFPLRYLPPNLVTLNLQGGYIDSSELIYFPSTLKTLIFRNCDRLTDWCVIPSLTHLELESCGLVDSCIQCLIHYPRLIHLNLSDNDLTTIPLIPSTVQTLNLSFCRELTHGYFSSSLTSLDLTGCPKIRIESLQHVSLKFLSLQYCDVPESDLKLFSSMIVRID